MAKLSGAGFQPAPLFLIEKEPGRLKTCPTQATKTGVPISDPGSARNLDPW
jgi:hypothetical protein